MKAPLLGSLFTPLPLKLTATDVPPLLEPAAPTNKAKISVNLI